MSPTLAPALFALTIPLLASASHAVANPRYAGDLGEGKTFATPPLLEPNVKFRIWIYGVYDTSTQLFYDARHVDVLLGTLDLRKIPAASRRQAVLRERRKIAGALARVAAGKRKALSPLEERVRAAYGAHPERMRGAAGRIGTRTGYRDRFALGLARLARYRPYVEQVLRRHEMPTELVALAMIESLFDARARSWAGAYGYWQFLAKTGKRYLHINSLVDERRDPIVSTDGAARMLKENLLLLRGWPLAITGYNYGPERILRGAKKIGSYDLEVLLRKWGPVRYMRNSRSYYASFLAALHVMQNLPKYFPKLALPPPIRFDTVLLPTARTLRQVAEACGVPSAAITSLNPALTRAARSRARLPRGFPLRVPAGAATRCGPDKTKLAKLEPGARASSSRTPSSFSIVPVTNPRTVQ
jgi:membrane-bound lytic murein transglycosylase D